MEQRDQVDPDWIRGVLAGLPVTSAIATPPGMVAIVQEDVVNAGLDPVAVACWLQPIGGFAAVAYLRPASHMLPSSDHRAPLQPVSYFAVPVAALRGPGGFPTSV